MTKDCQLPLSIRELQIARLIVAGLNTREIALELYISENTVKFHRKNIYKKLRIQRSLELVNAFH